MRLALRPSGRAVGLRRARRLHWLALLSLLTLTGQGCDDDPTPSSQAPSDTGVVDGGEMSDAPPDGDAGVVGLSLTVSGRAVETCGSWQPEHLSGLRYQTPSGLLAGVSSVELLRWHGDPDPVTVPLPDAAGPVIEADLGTGEPFVEVDLGVLPEGSYSHIRVGLSWSRYQVMATAHTTIDVPGRLELDMALSDHENTAGERRDQGEYVATFSAFGQSFSMSGQTPLNCTLSVWGGIAATTGSRFAVTVPIPDGPVEVSHGDGAEPVAIELQFPAEDVFSWRDQDQPGFSEGVYDIAMPPLPSELPESLVDCQLFMADRCQGEAIAPVHPTWPMPDGSDAFCTDGSALVDPCPVPGEASYGQDANYQVNTPAYRVEGEVVHDEVTGLIWQRATADSPLDWWEARDHCAELDLAGETDWRLPSRVELVSLVDFASLDPVIDTDAFPDTPSDFYWTSSPVPFLNFAYGVRFELGFIYDHDPHGTGRVRCVRGRYDPPSERFVVDGETVRDTGTGLIWQREGFESPTTWLDALAACEALELAGQDDWRLPTLKEQQTLVDGRRLQPSTDVFAFPDTHSEWYWSATPIATPPTQGWATSFTDGYASIHEFAELHRVRCVR